MHAIWISAYYVLVLKMNVYSSGGHISKSDLVLFSSSVEDALEVKMEGGARLCGPQPPSAFAAMQAGLRAMEGGLYTYFEMAQTTSGQSLVANGRRVYS